MALTFRCIDTMKASRDSGSWTNAMKIEHINSLVQHNPDLTHIALAMYPDNPGYHSAQYVKEWFDAVHDTGKAVFFRPALTGATTTGDAAQKILNWQALAESLEDCWADGDAWDVWPEFGVEAIGNQAQWNAWIRDVIAALDTTFDNMNLDVDHTFFSMIDQRWIFGNQVEAATITAMGKLCIDFYPMDWIGAPGKGTTIAKVNNFIGQIRAGSVKYPGVPIYVTETGYNTTNAITDQDQRDVVRLLMNELVNVPEVVGFNYWVGYGQSFDPVRLYTTSSRTVPRPAYYSLAEKFTDGVCGNRVSIIS